MSGTTYYERNRDEILNRAKTEQYFLFALITESNIINDKQLYEPFSLGTFLS